MASTFSDRLRESKKNLLDLSLRNSLLNYRLGTRRGIQVVEESSKEIFEILVRQKKTMAFKPATETRDPIVQKDKQKRKSLKYPLTDSWLQTSLSDESLQTKLLATFLDATTYIEERGVNILFLSLGALKWYEDEKSTKELTAPLLLIPVTLERTSAREKFTLKYNDEDLEGNLSLSEKVRQDFGIMYPSFPNGDDLDVPAYFDQVKRSVERLTRWHVEADEIALGFFSFGKFLMYKDLDENTWPKGMEPDKHPILGTLLGDGFRDEDPFYSTEELLDPHWTPKNDFQVVDADSSQLLAILEISKGKNLVLQGPPGTGKSQTITNLIADALGNGKKVLFVSEKMAALEVVKRRLDQIGLGCACLELHSHKANKKLLLKELNQTLALGKPTYELEPQTYDSYTMLRETLNNYSNALHTPINNTGYTPFRVIGELIELEQLLKGVSIPSLRKLQITELVIGVWNKSNFKSWLDVLSRMQSHIQKMGMPETHPFYKSRAVSLLPSDKQSIRISLESSISTCEIHIRKFQELSELTDIRLPVNKRSLDVLLRVLGRAMDAPDLSEIHVCSKLWASKRNEIIKLLTLGAEYSRIYNGYSPRIIQGSWKSDVSKAHATLRKYSGSWWRVFLREYRDGRNQICKLCTDPTNESAQSLTDIASAIVEASRLQIMLSSHDSTARELFGSRWRGGFSDWQSLSQVAEWIMALHADIETNGINPGILSFLEQSSDKTQIDLLSIVARESATHFELARKQAFDWLSMDENWRKQFDEENFSDQLSVLKIMLANIDKLSDHVTFSNLQIEVAECGHSWLLDICDSWEGAANHLASFFKFAWFEELLRHVYSERQILQGFVGEKRSQALREFIRLDQRLLELNRHRLASLHWERLPKYSVDGQRGILLREFEKKSRHLSIRQLIEKAGTAVQAIKPVFMMSPMSIASFLPHAGIVFDIVIFDEASQVKPVDAFGALLRARQSVIVGDSKQLPPTNFFDSIAGNSDTENSEDDEADLTSDLESILGMMKSRGVLERSLRWHYRSRHESLIRVSNKEFYDDQLIIFPTALKNHPDYGIRFHYLQHGTYDRGRSRTNRIEAEAVAKKIMDHAYEHPHLSLGVVAFNLSQKQAIIDQLELLRRDNGSTESFFNDQSKEPFFVKNLESVQGDERDVMFISVGYGKGPDGSPTSMNFGALNGDGGERRLNVLISRAKQRCEIFSSLTWEDIDLSRTQARGVSAFKTYLRFAKTGILDNPHSSQREPDSPFELSVASALRELGFKVEHQVGSAGYFIDLAVVHPAKPGQYLLAVECDGASYHSAKSARDRDRLRQYVLEQLGWKFHRVWSTDWFASSEQEIRKLKSAVDRALLMVAEPVERPVVDDIGMDRSVGAATISELSPTLYYAKVNLGNINPLNCLFHDLPLRSLTSAISRVICAEGPIHRDEVYRRVANAAGANRIGNKIAEVLKGAILKVIQSDKVLLRGDFLWPADMAVPPIRDRSKLASTEKNIDLIAPEEIAEAIKKVICESCGIGPDAMASATCRRLGFVHVTEGMKERVNYLVSNLLKSKSILERDGQLFESLSK